MCFRSQQQKTIFVKHSFEIVNLVLRSTHSLAERFRENYCRIKHSFRFFLFLQQEELQGKFLMSALELPMTSVERNKIFKYMYWLEKMPTSMGPRSSSRVIARSVVSISLSLKSRNIPHAMKSSYLRFCNVDITNAICGGPYKMKFNFSSYVLSLVDREVPLRKDCGIRDTWKLFLAITSS